MIRLLLKQIRKLRLLCKLFVKLFKKAERYKLNVLPFFYKIVIANPYESQKSQVVYVNLL